MPDAPTPLDLDAIREMLADRPALGRSAALDLIHEVEVQRILIDALREGVCILQTARPALAWDEEAVRDELVVAVREAHRAADTCSGPWADEAMTDAVLAVVRDHLTAQPAPEASREDEREMAQVIDERDAAESMADRLAARLAEVLGRPDAIGEHSSSNDPWQNALDLPDPTITPKEDR